MVLGLTRSCKILSMAAAPFWGDLILSRKLIAEISLCGMALDILGGCYLAYDLLGGQSGPLRTFARAVGYIALFLVGYEVVLGLQYALVASTGMGALLAVEYRTAGSLNGRITAPRNRTLLFGFLRGIVLGFAGLTLAGWPFAVCFGLLSGLALSTVYYLGFTPIRDYEAQAKPRISKQRMVASLMRAIAVGIAGILSGLICSVGANPIGFGLRLGLAAGAVSGIVGLFSPAIEWWIEHLPERRMGAIGLALIVFGMVLQSVQYWVVVFEVAVK